MKCSDCGNEMIKGKISELNPVICPIYQFTPDDEARDLKIGNFFTENSTIIEGSSLKTDAWQCPCCKKVYLWVKPAV